MPHSIKENRQEYYRRSGHTLNNPGLWVQFSLCWGTRVSQSLQILRLEMLENICNAHIYGQTVQNALKKKAIAHFSKFCNAVTDSKKNPYSCAQILILDKMCTKLFPGSNEY